MHDLYDLYGRQALTLFAWLLGIVGAALVVLGGLRSRRRLSKQRTQWLHRAPGSAGTCDLPGSGVAAPAAVMGETPAAQVARLDRSTVGPYRIERPLGRGSMGLVYLAHDAQRVQPIAVKTMVLGREHDLVDRAEARERFFREAATVGRLHHPDIVEVFEAGEDQGLAYIAMEFVPGHDLSRHTSAGQLLPVPVVLRMMARVARALAYAHAQGVVHRDVKPANVMFEPVSQSVKVTDFGIASLADAFSTRTGLVLGTPSYMSPEQLTGARVDGRSDLYALGVMLFELLTGALPHRGETVADLLRQIVNAVAPDVRSLRPDLPAALAEVVARALEKQADRRHGDAAQFAAELLVIANTMNPPAAATVPGRATP